MDIIYPNAKVNLGLRILRKRTDRFHDISSIMLPINLFDRIEISESQSFNISYSGLDFDKSNELMRRLVDYLEERQWIEPLSIHLHKAIPVGSGLGGASSDLAFLAQYVLKDLIEDHRRKALIEKVVELSSDAAFFLTNKPSLVSGKGDELKTIENPFKGLRLCLVTPDIHISTKEAYAGLKQYSEKPIQMHEVEDQNLWKKLLWNDFETKLLKEHVIYAKLKDRLYKHGALLATLTGSGAGYVGLFNDKCNLTLDSTLKVSWHEFL